MLPADIPRDAVIVVRNLQRDYDMGGEIVHALRGVDLVIRKNEYVAIMGPSGSGKSTLMNMIGCLDSPSDGEYWLNGHRVSELGDDELARIRNKEIGFVFQTFNLLPRASALVLAGSLMGGDIERAVREVRAQGLLVVSLNMAGSVPEAADLVVTDPVQAGVMTVMAVADTAKFTVGRLQRRVF